LDKARAGNTEAFHDQMLISLQVWSVKSFEVLAVIRHGQSKSLQIVAAN
jgi:hypothetical protein